MQAGAVFVSGGAQPDMVQPADCCLCLTCLQILPTAFLASHDEVSSVSGVWSTVWTEGCPSEPAALRMFAPELAGLIAGGIASSSWDRKKGAAKVRLRSRCAVGNTLTSMGTCLRIAVVDTDLESATIKCSIAQFASNHISFLAIFRFKQVPAKPRVCHAVACTL